MMNKLSRTTCLYLAPALALAIVSCGTTSEQQVGAGTPARTPGEAAFHSTVKPMFENRCVWCHGKRDARAGLDLQDRSTALDPALRFVVPGDPAKSRIYQAVTLESAHPGVMPGDGWGITREQTAQLKSWISAGAPWPEGRDGRIQRKPYRVEHDDYR